VVFAPTGTQLYDWMIQQSATVSWSATHAITAVTVNAADGDVDLGPGAAGTAAVTQNLTWDVSKPVVTETWTGTTLNVSEYCAAHGGLAANECSASLDITVPPATRVTVATHSGDIDLNGVTGAVHLQTGSGDISLDGTSGAVWARAISGAISGNSILSATVDAGTGSGDITLQFDAQPEHVTSSVLSGETSIFVPPGDGYLITGRTISGQRDIDGALENSTSSRTISADSGSGDVQVQSGG
jgi:hypothetical protein